MDTYHRSLTSITAPLVVVQGVSENLRPNQPNKRSRILAEQKYKDEETRLNYGVQITIERELEDLDNECMARMVKLVSLYNVRGMSWWPSQETEQTPKRKQMPLSGSSQKRQLSKQPPLLPLASGSTNAKGVWFNIKYSDKNYEAIINGSKSSLSPYNAKGNFYGSLLPVEWMDKYYDYIPTVFITFYEIGADEKWDDLLINEVNRVKLKFSNTMIKFVAVLINLYPQSSDNVRIQNIVTKINMGSNSLFVLNGGNDEISKREQNMFVRKLMIGLKQYSNDFFDLQIQKLKKREIKDDQYSEKFFSARNLIKMAMFEQFKNVSDYSTKLLEYGYDRLLQSLKSIDPASQKKAYLETRKWLDIMCFNIVRSCIVLGDTNVAYRKFTFHVQQIRELDPLNFSFDWLSFQYTWLGELVESINEDIIPVDSVLLPTLGLKEVKYNSYNMPQNGFIYLQAANFREKSLAYEKGTFDNRVLLLTGSLDSFNKAKTCRFSRIESRIYILLGDVYYSDKNYSMAINNYFAGLSCYKQESCFMIVGYVLKKLLNCYIGLSKIRESCGIYIELCCMKDIVWEKMGSIEETKHFLQNSRESIVSLDLVNDDSQLVIQVENDKGADEINSDEVSYIKEGMFKIDVGIKKYKNLMHDGVDIQLVIAHNGGRMIDELEINHLEVDMGENAEFKVLQIDNIDDGSMSNSKDNIRRIECMTRDICEKAKCPLTFKNSLVNFKTLVLQLHVISKKVGKFYIPRIRINGTLNGIQFNTVVNVVSLDNPKRFFRWYEKMDGDDKTNSEIFKSHYPTNAFEVMPHIPKVRCSLKYEKVGFNGRSHPITMKFSNEDENARIKLHVEGNGVLATNHPVKVNWMDGEGRWLLAKYDSSDGAVLKPGDEVSVVCMLDIPQIDGLAASIASGGSLDNVMAPNGGDNCQVKFNIGYELVNEEDGGVCIDAVKEAGIRIAEIVEWHTDLRADSNVAFPDLFKIEKDSSIDVLSGVNIPVHTRRWLFTLHLKNVSFDAMKIETCKFVIRGPKGVRLKLSPEHLGEEGGIEGSVLRSLGSKRLRIWLEVSCRERLVRSVPVDVNCTIEYLSDSGGDERQRYGLTLYKGNLPHVDPRMLVTVADQADADDDRTLNVVYILENPTDRIFQYQTNLNPVAGVEIDGYVKSLKVSVLPFVQVRLPLKYRLAGVDGAGGGGAVQLPEFSVYDRQYQVFVKPTVASDALVVTDGHLFLRGRGRDVE